MSRDSGYQAPIFSPGSTCSTAETEQILSYIFSSVSKLFRPKNAKSHVFSFIAIRAGAQTGAAHGKIILNASHNKEKTELDLLYKHSNLIYEHT